MSHRYQDPTARVISAEKHSKNFLPANLEPAAVPRDRNGLTDKQECYLQAGQGDPARQNADSEMIFAILHMFRHLCLVVATLAPLILSCCCRKVTVDPGNVAAGALCSDRPNSGVNEVNPCDLLLQRLNDDLSRASLSINRNNIMYTFQDTTKETIDTGDSCSLTAEVQSRSATVRFGTGVNLDLSSGDIFDPFMLKIQIPVHIISGVNVMQRSGFRIFGRCRTLGSETVTFQGGSSTDTQILVTVDLNPSVSFTSEGNFEVSIEPTVAVAADIDDVDLNLRVSGDSANIFEEVSAFVQRFPSTLFQDTSNLFESDYVLTVFSETAPVPLGVPVGFSQISQSAESIGLALLREIPERQALQSAAGFAFVLERDLTAKVRSALGVDATGTRSFIISGQFQQLLLAGGSLEDILV